MEKNAPQRLFLSLVLLFAASCVIPPTYSYKNIDSSIKKICKDEFNIDVNVWVVGDTLWIYMPFKNLLDDSGQWDKDVSEDIGKIVLSLSRVFLSIDRAPKFYAFIVSDVEKIGADIYTVGFVPDMVKFQMRFISLEEREERVVFISVLNPQSLGDPTGNHIEKYEITMSEFIALLIAQNIEKRFYDPLLIKDYHLKSLNVDYVKGDLKIEIDARITEYKDGLIFPIDIAERTATKILNIYPFFNGVRTIEIVNNFNKETKKISRKGFKETAAEHIGIRDSEKKVLSKLRESNYYFVSGNTFYDAGQFSKAMVNYQKAIELNPNDSRAFSGLGNSYFSLGKPKEALANFKKSAEINPDNSDTHYNIGLSHISLGQYNQAIKSLVTALINNADKSRVLYALGVAYFNSGKYSEAINKYKEALELKPKYKEAYYNLGIVYFSLRNYDQTIASYEATLSIDPFYFEACYNLAHAYLTLEKYMDAEVYFKRAINIKPDYAFSYVGLATVYEYSEREGKVRENLTKAKEILETQGDYGAIAEIDEYLEKFQ